MVSKTKLYNKLDVLEAELRQRLITHLKHALANKNDLIFCVKGYHSFSKFNSCTDEVTAELVDIGSEILVLKQKLNEDSDGSLAERICWYCREWARTVNNKKNNSMELVKQFLDEIESTQ